MRAYHSVLGALVLLSASASAATDTTSADQHPPSKTTDSVPSPDHKYCLVSDGTTTDSRIHSRECKTKAEWSKQGVDIDELIKANGPMRPMR